MRIGCLALLMATLFLPAAAPAQQQGVIPAEGSWISRIFAKPAKPGTPTLLLPDAPLQLRSDQSRETWLEKRAVEKRMEDDKRKHLLKLRTERDRKVAIAIAEAAIAQPFIASPARPRATPATTVEPADASAAAATVASIEVAPPKEPAAHSTTDRKPALPSPTPLPTPNAASLAKRGAVNPPPATIYEEGPKSPASTKPYSPGFFALLLTGMFLLPSAGMALLLVGAAHLRSHSFFSGSMILAVGGSLLWGAWSLAHVIDPTALMRSEPEATRPATDSETLSPMQAMQPDVLWNNE